MPVKFIAIYQDPWTNDTNEFVLVLNWISQPLPSSGTGSNVAFSIILVDPQGSSLGLDFFTETNSEATTATAYPFAYSDVFNSPVKKVILIPPGWQLRNHIRAIGLQGTLEELKGYF